MAPHAAAEKQPPFSSEAGEIRGVKNMWKTIAATGLMALASLAQAGTYTASGTASWDLLAPGSTKAFGPADPASGSEAISAWFHLPSLSHVNVTSSADGHMVLDGAIHSNNKLPIGDAIMQATWQAHVVNSGILPMPVTAVVAITRTDAQSFSLPLILPGETVSHLYDVEPNEISAYEFYPTANGSPVMGTPIAGGKSFFDYGMLAPGHSLDVAFSLTIYIQAAAPVAEICSAIAGCDVIRYGTANTASLIDATVDLRATAPVPEPETYAMMLSGLGVLGAVARRRRMVAKRA